MEFVENKDDQGILAEGKEDAEGNLIVEKENETGSSHQEGNSIDMDSAYGTGDIEEMLEKIKSNMRKENGILMVQLENEKDENANLRVELENEKVNLKKEIRDLKDENDKYMVGRAVANQQNKKYKVKIAELEKEIEERNQDSEIEALKEEIIKLNENKISPEIFKEYELLK